MNTSNDFKSDYYSRKGIVINYEYKRFRRGGGRFVQQLEEQIIRWLIHRCELPKKAIALDSPTGTGRFITLLKEANLSVYATDISRPMLDAARRFNALKYFQCSADSLPFANSSIHLILMSRFCFHFYDPLPFFHEASRVLVPKGYIIVDMYHYTPRSWFPIFQKVRGGQTFTHSTEVVYNMVGTVGLQVLSCFSVFFLPPYFYGLMPLSLVKRIEKTADKLVPKLKAKSYYLLRKSD